MIAMGLSSSNCIFVCTVVCSISLLGSTSCFPVRSKRTSRWSWSGNYFVVPLTRHACNSSRTLTRTLRGYHMDYVLRRVLRCELHSDPIRSDPIQFKMPSDRLSPPDRKSACCFCVRSFRFSSAVLSSCWREATYTYSNTYSHTYYRYAHARPLIFARRSVECEFIETPVLHSAHQIRYSAELENTRHYMCFSCNFCTGK